MLRQSPSNCLHHRLPSSLRPLSSPTYFCGSRRSQDLKRSSGAGVPFVGVVVEGKSGASVTAKDGAAREQQGWQGEANPRQAAKSLDKVEAMKEVVAVISYMHLRMQGLEPPSAQRAHNLIGSTPSASDNESGKEVQNSQGSQVRLLTLHPCLSLTPGLPCRCGCSGLADLVEWLLAPCHVGCSWEDPLRTPIPFPTGIYCDEA